MLVIIGLLFLRRSSVVRDYHVVVVLAVSPNDAGNLINEPLQRSTNARHTAAVPS